MHFYEALAIVIYTLIMIAIGVYSYQKSTGNSNEFLIGGRKIGAFVTALSAGAAGFSAWVLMGLPGAMYFSGLSTVWLALGITIGAYLSYIFVAPRLRVYTEVAKDAITLPVFFENRYKDKSRLLKITSSIFILIFFTLYTSAGMVSGGKLFESAFGMEYTIGMLLTSIVVVLYTFLGGFLAVSLTDLVQGMIMVMALIVVPLVAIRQIGGVEESLAIIQRKGPEYLDLFKETSWVGIISLLSWGIGYFGQPHILARYMAIDTVKQLTKARRIGITWMIFTVVGALLVGLVGIAYLQEYDQETMRIFDAHQSEAETIFIYFANLLFHPFITGFLLTAILAAVMSTISSQLLVTSSSLTEDIYKAFVHKKATEKQLLLASRLSVLIVAVVAVVLSIHPRDNILNLTGNAWAGFGAAFAPLILVALMDKKSTWQGALAGMLVGGITVLVWVYVDHPFQDWYEMVPGVVFSLVTNLVVSKITYKPNPVIEKEFNQVKKMVRD